MKSNYNISKKPKKKKGKEPGKEPDWTIEDNYAKYASKFKRDPRTGPNET